MEYLFDPLIERHRRAQAEDHHRDDKDPEIKLQPMTEGVLLARRSRAELEIRIQFPPARSRRRTGPAASGSPNRHPPPPEVFTAAVEAVEVDRRRRGGAAEWPVIADPLRPDQSKQAPTA